MENIHVPQWKLSTKLPEGQLNADELIYTKGLLITSVALFIYSVQNVLNLRLR